MSNGFPHKKSSVRIIGFLLSAFVILLFLCALCLPMFFSTAVGKKILIKMISNRTGFQIEIKELSLSWFGFQSAKEIHVQKKQELLNFTAQEVQTDAPLWKIVFSNHFGQMQITAPNLQISKPFQSTAHLRQKSFQAATLAIHPKVEMAMSRIDLPARGKVIVKGGKVVFNSPGLEPVAFDQIALSLDMTSNEELALALNCTTSLQGQVAIKGSASHLKAQFPTLAIQSTINQLPVRGIDQLVSLIYPEVSGLIYSFLGPTINLGCNLSSSSGNFDLRFNAISPQITAYVATQSLNGTLSLKSPAELDFNLTPAFFQKITKLYPSLCHLTLTSPALFQTTIEQFSCPVPSNIRDLLKSSFQAKLLAPPQISLMLNGKPLSLNSLNMSANSSSLEQQFFANLTTGLETEHQLGSLAIESNINMLFKNDWNGTISLHGEKFPIDLISAFTTSSSLSNFLGTVADINADIDFKTESQKLHLNWQSDLLKVPALDLSLGKSLTLISPSQFTFTLNPKAINGLLPQHQFQLVKAVPFQGTLQNLNIPVQNIRNSFLDVILNAGQITFSGLAPFNFAKMQTQFTMNTFDQMSLQIDGETIKAMLAGSYNPGAAIFTLTKPLNVQYTLDPPTFKALIPTAPLLAKPSIIQLSVDPFPFLISGIDLSKLKVKGQLSSAEMVLGTQGKQIALQNTAFPFQWDGAGKTAAVQLSSQVQNPSGSAGSMQGQFNLSHFSTDKGFDISSAALQGFLDLQNLSATLLDTFSGKCLSTITGPTFNSKFKIQSSPDKQNLNVKWISPNLNIDVGFVMDNSCLQLQNGNNQLTWTLTSEGYKALDQILTGEANELIPFEINEASTFIVSLSKFALPIVPKAKVNSFIDRIPNIDFNLAKFQFNATGRNPKLTFFDKSSHDIIQLTNLNFLLNKNEQGPFAASMDSTVLTQGNKTTARNGSISLNGQLEQTLNTQGVFDLSQLTGRLQFKAEQFPSRALDIIARAKGRTDFPYTTVFGNKINATLNIELNKFSGPVSLNVNTPLTRADISGTIKNGALMLEDAIHVQMKITPEISRLVLKEVNPLNLSYLYSQEPVTLEIPASGFYFPLYPFHLAKIAIPKARIELGKIACRNEGNVHITLGLLKTKQFEKTNDLILWFAPLDLNVKQGLVDMERTEILLAETFDICLWGNVDLVKDYIDMTLGLTAQTLSKAFGIKNLPENYVLRIPMRGKADNVQIDTGKATTKIALLLAWQQAGAAGALGKGPAGAIIGGLINKMATLPDSNAKVPPPKHPFPWEVSNNKSKTSHESTVKKRQFKPDEKPLKQILKFIR
jgi:hypothetical protein